MEKRINTFIDIHSHILPGVDDGARNVADSLAMLNKASMEGISHVVLTPHYMHNGRYNLCKEELLEQYKKFKNIVKQEKIDIELLLGNELYICNELDDLILNKQVCSYNNSDYVLIEFPFHEYDDKFDNILRNIAINGFKIVIAHPERYRYVQKNVEFCRRWIKYGCLLQGNQTSLFDQNEKIMMKLLEKKYLTFIASDAHNRMRPCSLLYAYEKVSDKFGLDYANKLFYENQILLLTNKGI